MREFLKVLYYDERGQELVEYALMAGFVAVAAGAIMPGVALDIQTIMHKSGTMVGTSTIRIVSGLLAVFFLGAIVVRRKQNADE